ncbi:MAG: dTDP-glucose 4,6-dehydratase [Phycisphaerales bacterium]|nr:dTDP-glucose 4,6-dehydratase [Phycisphaerales bacterium]MCI0675521.1 dTDP-glucose 4,6-dehydratase [Phycisphaerales bacterium]
MSPPSQTPRTLLVTGGAGFIGSNFLRFVLEQRPTWRIVNFDALTYAGNLANLTDIEDDPRYAFIHADIRDREAVAQALADHSVDGVVHFAAESHVDRSIMDSGPFLSTNVIGTQVMLDAARQANIARFVHIGTDEVYGELPLERTDLKFTEETPIQPNSPYSASKAAADMLALAYHHTFGMNVVVTRCSNNFGPYQYPEKVIPLFVTNLIDGKKVPLYGDGKNVRDWLHVIDHCEAILAVLERGLPGEVYNIGGNNERSNNELTRTILKIMALGEEMIQPVTDRLGHDRRYAIDAAKIKRGLNWQPTRSAWPTALEQTIAWYRDHEHWWRPLKEKPKPVKVSA